MTTPRPGDSGPFDVIVVGAGVVGCAVARKLTLEGARVLVLEKADDPLDGASKGNSALLHTGFDAPTGSVEQRCVVAGYHEYLDIRNRLSLPLVDCGAMVVAWNEDEAARLDGIVAKAHANGVTDVRRIDVNEARRREPGLGDGVAGAVRVPGESVIDPWTTPLAYLLQAVMNGARFERGAEVIDGSHDGSAWRLSTRAGEFTGRCVINCAGLYGDVVNRRLIGEPLFPIRPRKGEFVVFDKSAAALVDAIILPVPSEHTKGVVVCRTVFGNLLVGPTATEQDSRDDASVDAGVLEDLKRRGVRILPGLASHAVTATYAGLRPATDERDYRIEFRHEPPYVSVGGIRSTGLSGALGIANLVCEKLSGAIGSATPPAPIAWPEMPGLSAFHPRDWQQRGNGGIVCHCELVTRREIDAALDGPLAARTLGGLKRRTRVTMGRCQGFYCTARLAEITANRLKHPMTEEHGR